VEIDGVDWAEHGLGTGCVHFAVADFFFSFLFADAAKGER
jgi:hypothetical protein